MKKPKEFRIAGAIAGCEAGLEDCLKRAHQYQKTRVKLLELFHTDTPTHLIMKGLFKCSHYVFFYLRKANRYHQAKEKLYRMNDAFTFPFIDCR